MMLMLRLSKSQTPQPGPFAQCDSENQWEISEVGRLSAYLKDGREMGRWWGALKIILYITIWANKIL